MPAASIGSERLGECSLRVSLPSTVECLSATAVCVAKSPCVLRGRLRLVFRARLWPKTLCLFRSVRGHVRPALSVLSVSFMVGQTRAMSTNPGGSYYDRLGVPPDAPAAEIKRAFRRQMARCHPDKVQHLDRVFQDLAAQRAAELTEAYRVLLDPAARAAYDESLRRDAQRATPVAPPADREGTSPGPRDEPPDAAPDVDRPPAAPTPLDSCRRSGDEVIRRATMERLRDAIVEAFGAADATAVPGFDLSCSVVPRRGLFRKAEADLRLLARFVPRVDAGVVTETWPLAARAAAGTTGSTCVFLLGTELAPPAELASAIAGHRRHWRATWPLTIVPVSVRDWEALVPRDAPRAVRLVVDRLRRAS